MKVRWGNRNLRHLLVDNGSRGIVPEEVEEVIGNPTSQSRRKRKDTETGRQRRTYRGRTDAGRLLVVLVEVLGQNDVRPITAWEPQR